MNTHELWLAALGELELTISKPNFLTWFKQTFIGDVKNGEAVICVPNNFTKSYLEKNYHTIILKAVQSATNFEVRRIIYKIETRREVFSQSPKEIQITSAVGGSSQIIVGVQTVTVSPPKEPQLQELNPKYVFSSFIVGKGNEFAHAASLAVAQKPGVAYNPLFIYGGAGLGKTHLLQAIGREMVKNNSKIRVLYATCERFTNEFINAVRTGRGKEFKDVYRNVDLLLIDDIQFIAGKEGTQEEFFHTFNTLHQANKQVVITSDRPPKAIVGLEKRLQSRLEWGMITDISSPDLETRMAILKSKCAEKSIDLPEDAFIYIATLFQSNIRELEGALNKIIAFHQFKNLIPTIESIKSTLGSGHNIIGKAAISPRQVIGVISQFYDVPTEDLLGKSREKRLAFPRQIIMYIMRQELRVSFPTIGREIGGRDHTTAMHAHSKILRELEIDQRLQQEIELIKQKLFIS